MCLLIVAHRAHADLPLIVAGNRDEFHNRPTQNAHWWADQPDVLGGRDLQAGGSWMAAHRNGRFATVTNFRDADKPSAKLKSRGHLITDFLHSPLTPRQYLERIDGDRYAGFNLLVADGGSLMYLSNRGGGLHDLAAGVYGVANSTLDTPWPKVERCKSALQQLIDTDRVNETTLLRMLDDREKARTDDVIPNGLPFATAHALSAPFIVLPEYGTRCSSVMLRTRDDRLVFTEKRFDASGRSIGKSDFAFDIVAQDA